MLTNTCQRHHIQRSSCKSMLRLIARSIRCELPWLVIWFISFVSISSTHRHMHDRDTYTYIQRPTPADVWSFVSCQKGINRSPFLTSLSLSAALSRLGKLSRKGKKGRLKRGMGEKRGRSENMHMSKDRGPCSKYPPPPSFPPSLPSSLSLPSSFLTCCVAMSVR